jgi:hypothetical protein
MRRITRRQFDAFCYARQPLLRIISEEVDWFEAFNKKLLATIVFDRTDSDYGYIILGRDSQKMFRCIDVSANFCSTKIEAEHNLRKYISKYKDDGNEFYSQGDEEKTKNDILIPQVEDEKLHPYFKALISEDRLEAARNIIKEIVYSYVDIDGNYIKEFQTHGFDARLWELYLYIYLHNAGLGIIREKPAPDYHIDYFGYECFIEAVTVNPSRNPNRPDPEPPRTNTEIEILKDYLAIKFGSSLYTKIKKKYWDQEDVKGKPLILAIHDYHMPYSMTWSRSALEHYLYGCRPLLKRNNNKEEIFCIEKIDSHSWKGKTIPSNFFAQEDSENISAILFSNAATITKFNRMGKLAGLGSKEHKLIRVGYRYDPLSYEAIPFRCDVDSPEYEESWSDSLIMYHNPNAKHPIDINIFSDISHIMYDEDKQDFVGRCQPYDVLSSITLSIV